MPGLPISIITPTLNAERYLAECLLSVRSQGWPDLEQLVIDGGSTDATERLVRASDAVWVPRPGVKQAAAINVGLRLARGEVVAWLNSDDLYAPGAVAYVAQRFASDPMLDVLFGDCQVVDASGEPLWQMRPGGYDFNRLLRRGNSVAQPAVFLRKRVFEQVGYLDETLDFGMDYELWLRLRRLNVAYVPRVLATFRWHSASKTATNLHANWHELLRIVRRHGGGWTPRLVWLYARARLTLARQRVAHRLQHAGRA
ncbi:MAG: glycosyltransferase [Chloroflexota bacterium]|nr:glycosyltransferase [Chloroflexota bacterium]